MCAGLSHTVAPYFCQHSSTLIYDWSRCFGNQGVRDRRLIGRALIIIPERKGLLEFLNFELTQKLYEYVCLSILFRFSRVVQDVDVFHYQENPLIETNQWDIS